MNWQCLLRLVSLCSDDSQSSTSFKLHDPGHVEETLAGMNNCFELFSELLEVNLESLFGGGLWRLLTTP